MDEKSKEAFLKSVSNSKIPKDTLLDMLSVPEYASAVEAAISKQHTVTDDAMYELVKSVYFGKLKNKDKVSDFNFPVAKQVLRVFADKVAGDFTAWSKDYEAYSRRTAESNPYIFLRKLTTFPKNIFDNLIAMEDFTDGIDSLYAPGEKRTVDDVYSVIKNLYFPLLLDSEDASFKEQYKREHSPEAYRDLSYKRDTLKGAIKYISKKIFNGNPDGWKPDYEVYRTTHK